MLSSISVFLKKNIRKAAKPVFFPDYHFSHLSSSLKKQRLCRTPNTLQQCLVKSVVFKTSRPVDGDYCYWTFMQAKPDFNETEMLYIFSVPSSLPLWLVSFFVLPSLTWPKLFCWLLPWCLAPMLTQEHPLNIPWDLLFPHLWLCYSSTRFFHRFL